MAVHTTIDKRGRKRMFDSHTKRYYLKCKECGKFSGRWVMERPHSETAFCKSCDMDTEEVTGED